MDILNYLLPGKHHLVSILARHHEKQFFGVVMRLFDHFGHSDHVFKQDAPTIADTTLGISGTAV
jgi:hypothetical protein